MNKLINKYNYSPKNFIQTIIVHFLEICRVIAIILSAGVLPFSEIVYQVYKNCLARC